MSISESQPKDCIAVDQSADHDELVQIVADLADTVRQQDKRIEEQDKRIEEQDKRIDDLEDQLKEERATRAKESAQDRKRIHQVEQAVEERLTSGKTMGPDKEEKAPEASTTPKTPLERTTAMPQEMIADETANVRRAVFVAADLDDYTTKVPAGRAIKSGELRRVLKAGTDARGHSQTVDRVISVLDDLGGDEVKIVDRRGERRVVFTEQIVERLKELTAEQEASHDVVTQEAT
jgi:DNA repair exonuclease SbcCD ATPase subunit